MLDQEQIAFFKDNGYLLVPGAMDQDLCARVRDMMWSALPPDSSLRRDDQTSHVGPIAADERSEDSTLTLDGYRWLNRALGVSQEVIELIYSPSICAMAAQLLGGELRQAVVEGSAMGSRGPAWPGGPTDPALGNEGARGVYCTLPYGDRDREPDRCHTDGHPFQLGVVGLIHDTPAGGGAFKVWPKSHKRLYPTYTLRYDQPRIPFYDHLPSFKGIVHTPAYLAEIDALNEDTEAVECWGEAGDIVFWHHRTAHMAGHNYSDIIRQAVLADFWTHDLDKFRAEDAQGDMWRDWSPAVRNAALNYSEATARAQRLSIF
ncbi:MAG: phytanoyl-CoA dioxygenase family protein [Pseudomonadota bacterium]